ncbi:hypothetical protein BAOM_p005 (plasmid) [Peribacillus asahii]|uniref:Uncharacterized protein n=1 Tax=Peribacillus asahii TaxID=228899 RepID=A0A3Q9RT68_9BACI|nr:hypothetical protein [Peribacillus asahii]AZV45658.1 hypothetical protein BAOM_p005 [Peribacillus asahii]
MAEEKKARSQYNWKFKENESKEFYEWFDNQDNIASSLRSVLYHIIELYGNENFLEPTIQKQMFKNAFIFESLKNKDVLSVNHEMIFEESKQSISEGEKEVIEDKNDKVISSETEEDTVNRKIDEVESAEIMKKRSIQHSKEKSNIFKGINKDLL